MYRSEMRQTPSSKHFTLAETPPYCFMANGRTHEEATVEAMSATGSRYAADALMILWQLRRSCLVIDQPDQKEAGK
jgi:hypothetical protein